MKNPYKQHLRIFAKNTAQNVLIQRDNGMYYISDGFTMIRLSAGHYELFATPINPVYVPLEDGQSIIRRRGEKQVESNPGGAHVLRNMWEKTDARIPAKITRLLSESTSGDKLLRYVHIGDGIHLYNDDYIFAMRQYCNENVFATVDRFPVLKWEDPAMGTGCIILPVNNPAARDIVVKIAEVITA